MQCSLFLTTNLASIIIMLLCVSLIPICNIAFFNIYSSSGVESCPLCLGETICNLFNEDSFALDWSHFWVNLLNLGIKNLQIEKTVFFGKFDEKKVVLKIFPVNFKINNFNFIDTNVSTYKEIISKQKLTLKNQIGYKSQKLNFCPRADRLGVLLKPLNNYSDNITNLYFNLQYMLEVNVEPIIQQVTKDWAVAPYLGSCGFIAVSEFCGDSLTWTAPKLNWSERAEVAIQLLQFAFNATFDNPNFAFYFTDMYADNFAVSPEKNVRLVDLENVIVVDKLAKGMPQDWDDIHQVHHDDSNNEFAFSMDEICSHQISDFNIYAICQGILSNRADLISGGLLHSSPDDMHDLRFLIEECTSSKTGTSRFDVAHSIMKILNDR